MGPRLRILERLLLGAILVILSGAFVLSYLAATDTTSCEDTRIEIRRFVAQEIKRSRGQLRDGTLFQLFPDVPRATLRGAVLKANEGRQATRDNLSPADC